jgi:DNA end-binding protein Ku
MRALWKGSLSFGLVNIPVEMHSASRTNEVKFKLLHQKDGSEIRYARICKHEDKEVPWDQIVKGYENAAGKYIILTEDEIKKAMLAKSKAIEIVEFTKPEEIDPILYEKPYVLTPQKGAEKAYVLLLEALKKSKKVGIANFTMHSREHIGAVISHDDFIFIMQLRYKNELISLKEIKAPDVHKVSPKEMDIALQLINHMEAPFKIQKFEDPYTKQIQAIIKQKEKGKKAVIKSAAPAPSKKVHDIMSLLKASLDEKGKKTRRNRASA